MIGLRGLPANYSGIEVAVEEIGARLVDAGHEVTVYCMGRRATETYKGMRLVYIPTIRGKNTEMVVYSMLASLHALGQGYDLVHLHAFGPAVMTGLFRLFRRPVVVTCHGLDYLREKWGLIARTYIRFGETMAMRHANAVICVSRSMRSDLEARHRKPLDYIPNGSTVKNVPAEDHMRTQLGLAPKGYFIFVGRLVECKRVDLLIEAFRQLETDMKLVIVGGGSDDAVARLSGLAAGDERIVLTGPVYGEALDGLFGNAAFFVLPSVLEGLPVALIEALGHNLPVIVSDLPENLEVVADGNGGYRALVCERDSVGSLRDTLAAALRDRQALARQYADNRAFVMEKYGWDSIAAQTAECYARAVQA
ncbi:glycosyltransferase family 4 protein [Pelagibacterium xiamenense]|uniref:glycosyltransferase family 4 protein n=1 Tax=Pelagibacterium xiamenense TaxID=2901140 RepID=UPI001E5E44FE|nr:glycosyltransferase family 4 protein [Pelagibacterium xiamenense]MCD7058913.1 glycosyltransferase family 4 protein [Pelagibacterium xiamenense]